MPQGDKSSYTSKQKRQAKHIEEQYEDKGLSKEESERRAWATVNKETGGGLKKTTAKKPTAKRKTAAKGKSSSKAKPTKQKSAAKGTKAHFTPFIQKIQMIKRTVRRRFFQWAAQFSL